MQTISCIAVRTRDLGRLTVSTVGLGCNQFGRAVDIGPATRVVHAAIDAGITFFDTADRYGYGDRPFSGYGRSESFLGAAVRGRREAVVIATKFGLALSDGPAPGAGREYVVTACEASLRRLGTDYLDLLLLHRPDPTTPVGETLQTLDGLVTAGKVREIGWCNVDADQISSAALAADEAGVRPFAVVQNEYSLLRRDVEHAVLPACRERDVAFVPYFPLAGGLLTGKYRSGEAPPADARLAAFAPNRPHLGLDEDNLRTVDALATFAESHGHTLLELAVSWLLARPGVPSVIAGATRPEQVVANVSAAGWALDADQLAEVDRILADVSRRPGDLAP